MINFNVNLAGEAGDAEIIMAIYDDVNGDNPKSIAVDGVAADVTKTYTVKLFRWNSIGKMEPLANPAILTL